MRGQCCGKARGDDLPPGPGKRGPHGKEQEQAGQQGEQKVGALPAGKRKEEQGLEREHREHEVNGPPAREGSGQELRHAPGTLRRTISQLSSAATLTQAR